MSSKRGYLTIDELEQFADVTVSDNDEAEDQISMAEEIIDEFVGPQNQFIEYIKEGLVSAVNSSTIFTLENLDQEQMDIDYLKGCWVEIIGGSGAGQLRKIISQTKEGVITVEEAFSTTLDTTSYYKIWQLGKFPRNGDVFFDSRHTPSKYYKSIPEKVKRATAAQVEYMINMGSAFFASDKINKESERLGDYSYSKGAGTSGTDQIIAPKAKLLLRGIINRKGAIVD